MPWEEITVTKWSELVEYFDPLDCGPPAEMPYLFRGQSNAKWQLVDSLSRLLEPLRSFSSDLCLHVEELAHQRFMRQAHFFMNPSQIPEEKSLLAWWGLMQHFGCPTRLLDWTASPYVAAYFAVVENEAEPGVIWGFDGETLLEETEQSDVSPFEKRLNRARTSGRCSGEKSISSSFTRSFSRDTIHV